MEMLEKLRLANPGLPLYSVADPAFSAYGRILRIPGEEALIEALSRTPVPEEGNSYLASAAVLEETDAAAAIAEIVFGGMPAQAGFCNGHGYTLNAMEYHKCSEVNASDTGLVLLLALPEECRDGILDSADVKAFYLPPRTFIEIYPRVLHFAPCRIRPDGFRCLVVLEKGVNEPLPAVDTAAPGEQKLLWMRGKWLTCHPDSPQASKGAFTGIRGRNITLALPE